MPLQYRDPIKRRKEPVQDRSITRVDQILRATRKILREQGLAAVTTAQIARVAKVPVGSVYQYFPNKKAVFFALYTDYLESLRDLFEEFEQAEILGFGWVEFFEKLLHRIKSVEKRDIAELELFKALLIYPELQEIDHEHGRRIIEFTARHLQRLGAKGSAEKLQRLAWFIYELNNAAWQHQLRSETQKQREESIDWERRALMSALQSVFPD